MRMAFSTFAQAAKDNSSSSSPTVREGAALEEIQTNAIGLPAVNGEVRLKLSEPWPADSLPPTTSSLLAVASGKGLLAAAGPEHLVLSSTDHIRAALLDNTEEKATVRNYEPNLRLPRSRLAHVAFTADESVLLVSAQQDGGIDAYSLRDIEKGQPAVIIATGGKPLRALVPNPAADADLTPLVAAVTLGGELLLADLKLGSVRTGTNGPVLRSGVTSVAWSPRGKALVAGLSDGTAVQLKPDGQEMAIIPKLTTLDTNYYVSSISWLSNDSFFFVYDSPGTEFPPDSSEYYMIDREPKTTNYTFKKISEPIALMGKDRLPTSHFVARLRGFPPSLSELLLVAATSSTDVGLLTKTDKALSSDQPITGEFTTTTIEEDGRRAVLPLSSPMDDSSPIGMVVDFSSKETVRSPIPTEIDIEETSTSVPQLFILNNDGLLCSWWIIYNDSVIQKMPYPGMQLAGEEGQESIPRPNSPPKPQSDQLTSQTQPQPPPSSAFVAPASSFGKSGFASMGQNSTLAFGTPSMSGGATNAFGTGQSSFGQPSTIGGPAKTSWISTGFSSGAATESPKAGFGQPAFGSASSLGGNSSSAFGSANSLGKPAFGQASNAPAFGASGFGAKLNSASDGTSGSPFGAASGSGQSGFASFAQAGAFGSQSSKDTEKPASPFGQHTGKGFGGFGQPSQGTAFGKPSSVFGGASSNGFAAAGPSPTTSMFGNPNGFKLDSSFKADPKATDNSDEAGGKGTGFGFGAGFGSLMGSQTKVTSTTHNKEENMVDEQDKGINSSFVGLPANQQQNQSSLVTPPSTIGQPKATPAPPVSNLFGNYSTQSTTPQPPPPATTGWGFGNIPSTTPKDAPFQKQSSDQPIPKPAPFSFGVPFRSPQQSPKVKEEPSPTGTPVNIRDIPEAPLPPETVSKPRYVSGVSDASSSNSSSTTKTHDAPLPPDWTPANKSSAENRPSPDSPPGPVEDAPLPPEPQSHQRTTALPSEPSSPTEQEEEEEEEEEEYPDFDESDGEQEGEDSEPVDVAKEHHDNIATSPESSFKSGERSTDLSPTGGLFTKVNDKSMSKPPLFGEIGTGGPVFPPPKPHESPRSPSPIRNLPHADRLRSEASRSVSAPADRRSVIDQRKETYAQSGLAAQAQQAHKQETARQKLQQEEAMRRKLATETSQLEELEDDEDERLREELKSPVKASEVLDDFVTYQVKPTDDAAKSGVPAQIERLYRDINSMVDTLGINSRSLASFMLYQKEQEQNADWPQVLTSETPADALNDEWCLSDTERLREGQTVLDAMVEEAQVDDIDEKLQYCQVLLSQDIMELKMKFASIRKAVNARAKPEEALAAPLSIEQTSLQHELRNSAASVQSKLIQVEDALALLRAKLAEASGITKQGMFGKGGSKKPTIEAVTNTVLKMTKMAEQKSADIDVLELQLRKLDVKGGSHGSRQGTPNGTPHNRQSLVAVTTPGSSVYHTPGSRFGGSTRSTPGLRRSTNGKGLPIVSLEDREKWTAKAKRKEAVADMLRGVLQNRQKNSVVKA